MHVAIKAWNAKRLGLISSFRKSQERIDNHSIGLPCRWRNLFAEFSDAATLSWRFVETPQTNVRSHGSTKR